MPTNVINKIKLPNNDVYDIQDANALPKTTTINNVSKAQDANTYTLTGDDIKLSSSYVVPQTYTPPEAGVTSIEDSIANLVKHVDDAVSGSVTSVDEGENSHLNITTATGGAVTVNVATGYVIPPDTVQASASGGSTLTLVSTGNKYTWDEKQAGITMDIGETPVNTRIADSNKNTKLIGGTNVTLTPDTTNGTITFSATDTTYSTFDASNAGLVPAGGSTDGFLKNDGTWATPTDTTYDVFDTTDNGLVPAASGTGATGKYLKGDGTWDTPDNTTYSVFTTSTDGLVPAADGTGETGMFLKGDGTWATPDGTTYTEGTGIDIDNSNVISNTGVLNVTTDNTGSTANNGTITISKLNAQGTAEETSVAVKGLANAAYKGVDSTITDQSTSANVPTSDVVYSYVQSAISGITGPMIFKGAATITADSTDTTKCSISVTDPASSANIKVGYTYKITTIASSPVYTGDLKVGDVLIAKINNPTVTAAWVENTDWTIVPSGDDVEYPKLTYIVETEEGQPVKYIGIDYGNIN